MDGYKFTLSPTNLFMQMMQEEEDKAFKSTQNLYDETNILEDTNRDLQVLNEAYLLEKEDAKMRRIMNYSIKGIGGAIFLTAAYFSLKKIHKQRQ